MPRRKQDCPKRMKWEGGEEGSPEEGDKLEGDEETGSITPVSDDPCSPSPGRAPSPPSPKSLNEEIPRELTSSRCNSKESAESVNHSPSSEMLSEQRASLLRGAAMAGSALSPIGVALPPTLPVATAAALLPPQSAAMAAYLNAAAAAAVAQQSHRLMMTSPLPPAYNRSSMSPLVSSSAASPPGGFNHSISPSERNLNSPPNDGILDFSRKGKSSDGESDSDVANNSKPGSPPVEVGNGPLDLSCAGRKRSSDNSSNVQPPSRKAKTSTSDYKSPLAQWPASLGAPHLPYFAAAVAAASNLSPKSSAATPPELWNGKVKHKTSAPSDATKALEKMSELSKLGGDDLFRGMANPPTPNSASNRHSAWQSHWLNKGAEQAKDVLKCVWCKQSFPSLAAMTTHMKEAKHCGVNVPVPPIQPQNIIPQPQMSSPSNTNTSTSSGSSNKTMSSDLNMLIKETMPLPRKLVRGQDVWLGKGAEQTRQILKCMWCGQSFRSLAEMTSHMQQTQHYTNIISQEQIISWRSSDDNKSGGSGGAGAGGNPPPSGASSHVSAVLTCKVCDQAFSSLKELSNHMVKNSHYKEHIMRSITESGGRRRQTREKRKKSLPVRKLLELERAQHDFKNGDSSLLDKMQRDPTGAGRITCEKCGHKIETSMFVDHIRQCVGGGTISSSQRNFLKSALMSNTILPPESPNRDKAKSHEKSPSPVAPQRSPTNSEINKDTQPISENNNGSSPSVLNAIEKLIEKSFDSRTRQNAGYPGHGANAPMGSSILKRLGIDESVDYTKPLVDAQTMNLLRSYHQQQQNHFARRERSGSESSSISERGSSRVDSLTPERKMDPPGAPLNSTPRSTPDMREKSPCIDKNECHSDNEVIKVKKEIDNEDCTSSRVEHEVSVKKECTDDEDERQSYHGGTVKNEEDDKSPRASPKNSSSENVQPISPSRNSASPSSSDRSGTPRSTNGDKKSTPGGGSLGALSSMFDNLSGTPNENSTQASGKKGSSHPLAALQKLCDKTETHTNTRPHSSSSSSQPVQSSPVSASTSTPGTTPGAILAFSWACNDAVMTSDSIMKCAFCDTPFISKGAYRHHLSKMHFVKDGIIPDPVALKNNQPSSSNSNSGVPLKGTAVPANTSSGTKSPPVPPGFEESPHSKFLKYTELAKQLSSKYV